MLREQCRVGLSVTFGRTHGEKTPGVVIKMNPKKAKVQTAVARGVTSAGAIWNVPYSMLTPVNPSEALPVTTKVAEVQFPIGQRIVGVRTLTPQECEREGWEHGPYDCAVALVLSDGSLLYASQDYEGNGPGALFGRMRSGETITVSPAEVHA